MKALFLIPFILIPGCAPHPDKLFEQARDAFQNRQFDEALSYLNKAPETDLFTILEAEVLTGKGQFDEAKHLLNKLSPSPYSHKVEGYLALRQGDMGRAETYLNKALTETNDHGLKAEALILRSYLNGPSVSHEQALLDAIRYAQLVEDSFLISKAAVLLSYLRLTQFRYDECVMALAPVTDPAPSLAGSFFTNLGLCQGRLGFYTEAESNLERAISILKADGDPGLTEPLGELGNIYFFRDEFEKARQRYQEAYDLAMSQKTVASAARTAGNLAAAAVELNDWDQAESWNETSSNLKHDIGHSLEYTQLNQVFILIGKGRLQEARQSCLQMLQTPSSNTSIQWQTWAALGGLYGRNQEWVEANAAFEKAIDLIGGATSLRNPLDQMSYFARLERVFQDYIDVLIEQGDRIKALEVFAAGKARTLSERFKLKNDQKPQLKIHLPQDQSHHLVYRMGPEQAYLWVIGSDGIHFKSLGPTQAIKDAVLEYNKALIEQGIDPMKQQAASGDFLYKTLLAQALPLIGEEVVIVPDGELHNLSFGSLPVYGEEPHYWAEKAVYSVAVSPGALGDAPQSKPIHQILAMGAPLAAPGYPQLAYAAQELDGIRSYFSDRDVRILSGAEALPKAFAEADPDQMDAISFAAHGEVNASSPMDSALILSPDASGDFKLYARDILNIPIQAQLVTLSSCSSAGSGALAGEGLVGFVWAFFYAGAHEVTATLWNVEDRATATLMDHFYRALAQGDPPAVAMNKAQYKLIHSNTAYSKPYYWAAFQVWRR